MERMIESAVDMIAGAERPVVMGGTALKWSEGGAALEAFLDAVKLMVERYR